MNTRIREEVLDAMEEMEKQMENIRDSAQRAFDAIPRGEEFNAIRNRAEAYWKNGIDNLLDGGMSMSPLASTIGELKELSEEEEETDECEVCEKPTQYRMFDIDGTNLEEYKVCVNTEFTNYQVRD